MGEPGLEIEDVAASGGGRLVFSSVGDSSEAYRSWLPGRGYTLAIAYYGESETRFRELSATADICFWSAGSKFQNFYRFGSRARFAQCFVVDDDIEIAPEQISRCFDLMEETGAPVGSPAHGRGGRLSWPLMVAPLGSALRLTNFVEMTAVFMSATAVDSAMDAYGPYRHLLVGYGIDYIISSACYSEETPFIIDQITNILNREE